MDWDQYQLALRLLAEERVGRQIRMAEAEEEAAFQQSKRHLDRG